MIVRPGVILKASLERSPAADLANPAALYGRVALLA
jgi:hypothetical protein